jgi:hypothetical protein
VAPTGTPPACTHYTPPEPAVALARREGAVSAVRRYVASTAGNVVVGLVADSAPAALGPKQVSVLARVGRNAWTAAGSDRASRRQGVGLVGAVELVVWLVAG